MIVAGGTYEEICHYPKWHQLYGSGLRAAIALSEVSPGSTLHSYVPNEWRSDVDSTLASFGLNGRVTPTKSQITFSYLDAFERWELPAERDAGLPALEVSGDVILRFGFIEGDARVTGDSVIFDPQSSNVRFEINGSKCSRLAYVLNEFELLGLADKTYPDPTNVPKADMLRDAAISLLEGPAAADVIVMKDSFGGLTVFRGEEPERIPSYASDSFFKIGAGDIIAAAFASAWGEQGMDPFAAADYAARSASFYVEGPRLPLPAAKALVDRKPSVVQNEPVRILGVGSFELHSLVIRTEEWLTHLGGRAKQGTYLPDLSRVGEGPVDLLLVASMLTREELAKVASLGNAPAVVFWPGREKETARKLFPKSMIAHDYATALYHALRRPAP